MDAGKDRPVEKNDLQVYCAVLAAEFPFAAALNSQARQASADRAWFAISRFYANCAAKQPGKKGYPRFQHDCRSVEYKTTGWKLEEDGRHITFTDGVGIGRVRLIGKKETGIVVTCQNERSQIQNREVALRILKARLYELEVKQQEAEQAKLRGEHVDVAFGSQIRTVTVHPYTLVKDHRTNAEMGDTTSYLNGNIDRFVEAYLTAQVK